MDDAQSHLQINAHYTTNFSSRDSSLRRSPPPHCLRYGRHCHAPPCAALSAPLAHGKIAAAHTAFARAAERAVVRATGAEPAAKRTAAMPLVSS